MKMLSRFRAIFFIASGLSLVIHLGGCGGEPAPPSSTPPHKLIILEPKANSAGVIKVRAGRKTPCLVRFEHDGSVESPGAVLLGLTRGETYSEQYIADPRRVDDRTFEFKIEIKAPSARGKYLLTASLDPLSPGQQGVTATWDVNVE